MQGRNLSLQNIVYEHLFESDIQKVINVALILKENLKMKICLEEKEKEAIRPMCT